MRKSVAVDLKEAIEELFDALGFDNIMMEGDQSVSVKSFIKDFIKKLTKSRMRKTLLSYGILTQLLLKIFSCFSKKLSLGKWRPARLLRIQLMTGQKWNQTSLMNYLIQKQNKDN